MVEITRRAAVILGGALMAGDAAAASASLYDFRMEAIEGGPLALSAYRGKPVLVVNTASFCGYTPQYAGLQELYSHYKDRGFVIVGVPANNFGGQEPGSNEEIKTFCSRKYSVTFPMMSKVSVKGGDMVPLYQYLTSETGGDIKWNFTKILIGKDGKIIRRFEPAVTPDSDEVKQAVEQALAR